jgi:hypothetical protein
MAEVAGFQGLQGATLVEDLYGPWQLHTLREEQSGDRKSPSRGFKRAQGG